MERVIPYLCRGRRVRAWVYAALLPGAALSLYLAPYPAGADDANKAQAAEPPAGSESEQTPNTAPPAPSDATPAAYAGPAEDSTKQVRLGNTQYLYVVDEHSVAELEDLLQRADEIASRSLAEFTDLEVAMIIHGPSVQLFTQSSYPDNKRLIDLAAKLDAFNVIDVKICDATLDQFQIDRREVPDFIESVPFAPDEIKRLKQAGYINL